MLFLFFSCKKEEVDRNGSDLSHIPHNPTYYSIEKPEFFPELESPSNNPLTVEGIRLGRFLFYDPILSVDSTISCSSCHIQEKSFTDGKSVSEGINNLTGSRSSMSLINIGYAHNGLFWDGSSPSLEDQAIHPIENPVELGDSWENVEEKLRRHPTYPKMFRNAFPIQKKEEITRTLAAKALAQFERTLISANSKYDQAVSFDNPTVELSDLEFDGYLLFFQELLAANHPGCHHCHAPPNFGGQDFFNNGLDEAPNMTEFPDLGLGGFTGILTDNGKFKAPSLRNIEFTAPYMHDGRFESLEEVIDHYASGGHYAPNVSSDITGFELTTYQKEALIAFLKSLSDPDFLNNSDFSSPFE